jgi:O-antigen ligase
VQFLIPISLLLWIPVSISLVALLPPRRAVVASIIGAWLLLPPSSIPLPGLPDIDKMGAATVGILLGTVIFQPNRLLGFRLRWFDLPMLFWCIVPFVSSSQNGLGPYDGLSEILKNIVRWALPYLVGRLYLGDLQGLRELTIGIILGGIAYVPAVLLEVRLSPILKSLVYGIYQWEGARYGAYRPIVFLTTGLELGMWMTAVSLTAVWLRRCGALKQGGALSFGSLVPLALLLIAVLCRSGGALSLLLGGLFVLWSCTRFNTKLPLCFLLLIAPAYYSVRVPNLWSGDNLVNLIEKLDADRAQSLGYRFYCENMLIRRAMEQPWWGWGSWGKSRVFGPNGRDMAPTDGMWIIYLGNYGCIGLFSWTIALLLPPWLFLARYPVRQWKTSTVGPLAVVATLLGLYSVDCLLNGFLNLVYIVAGGGLICAVPTDSRRRMSIQDASKRGQLPWSPKSKLSYGRIEEPTILPDPSNYPIEAESHLLSIPQAQLARRYLDLARVLKNQGLLAEAKAAWIHALDLLTEVASSHPELPEAQKNRWDSANDIAWFLINEADPAVGDSQLAVRLATQATQAAPEAAAYWNTLGAAYYRAGRETDAITALERSVALTEGGTGLDFVFLALAHAQLGQYEQAHQWKSRADLWMEQHETNHSELSRLHAQACAYVTSNGDPPMPVP